MRWANLFLCLFFAFTIVGGSTPLTAADIKSRQAYPDEPYPDEPPAEQRVAEFCFSQRQICRKICNLKSRFEDNFDGCPQSCETREIRCGQAACFRWSEPEFLIAERFGGYKCAQ